MSFTDSALQQYQQLKESSHWFDVSNRTRIALTDEARVRFLHNLCSQQINELPVGQGREAFITSLQGKVVAHVLVLAQEDRILLETSSNQATAILKHLGKYAIIEDVEIDDLTAETCEYLITGANSADILSSAFDTQLHQQIGEQKLLDINGCNCILFKSPLCGSNTFCLIASIDQKEEIEAKLNAANVAQADPELLQILRIESGYPEAGLDITEEHLAQEVNRDEAAINYTKGCYLGQETIARIDAMGHVNKKLVLIKLDVNQVHTAGTTIEVDGKEVGTITSSCFSPQLDQMVGLCFLKRGHNDLGKQLETNLGAIEVISPLR